MVIMDRITFAFFLIVPALDISFTPYITISNKYKITVIMPCAKKTYAKIERLIEIEYPIIEKLNIPKSGVPNAVIPPNIINI